MSLQLTYSASVGDIAAYEIFGRTAAILNALPLIVMLRPLACNIWHLPIDVIFEFANSAEKAIRLLDIGEFKKPENSLAPGRERVFGKPLHVLTFGGVRTLGPKEFSGLKPGPKHNQARFSHKN